MRTRGWLAAMLLLAAACGKTHKAGRTPEETLKSLEAAVRDSELGQCYGLLSRSAQREMDGAMRALKGLAKVLPDDELAKIGMEDLADMSTPEILDASIEYAEDEQPASLDRLKKVQFVALDVKEYDGRARVRVSQLVGGRTREFTLPMVREGGVWKIDSALGDLNIPVRLGPDVQAAAAARFT